MKSWLKKLFSEGDTEVSVGSVSVVLVVVTWVFTLIWAQVRGVALVVTPTGLAALAAALYGLKKVPDIVGAIKGVRGEIQSDR